MDTLEKKSKMIGRMTSKLMKSQKKSKKTKRKGRGSNQKRVKRG